MDNKRKRIQLEEIFPRDMSVKENQDHQHNTRYKHARVSHLQQTARTTNSGKTDEVVSGQDFGSVQSGWKVVINKIRPDQISSLSNKVVRYGNRSQQAPVKESCKDSNAGKLRHGVNIKKKGQEVRARKSKKEVKTYRSNQNRCTKESTEGGKNKSSQEMVCFGKTIAPKSASSVNVNSGVCATSQALESLNFNRKTWMSDVTFLVQGKRIHCSKIVLSLFSPVFRSMFDAKNNPEKAKKLIELPGKDYESFVEFIKCFFPNLVKANITKQNVFKILSLAHEYNVRYLMKQCEEYLMKSLEVREPCINTIMRTLAKAKQFNLCSLKDACIKILSEKDPFAVQASGNKLGLQDTLHYLQGEIVLMKHRVLKEARIDLEKTCMAFEMTDVLQAFGGFEQAEASKLELSLKIGKSEELDIKTATSEFVCLYGLKFSTEIVYSPRSSENEASYMNLFLKCVNDGSLDCNWCCDVRAKCMLKMRVVGRKGEQITKTKTFKFCESQAFFTGLKTKLASPVAKNTRLAQSREFEAVVYFLANRPKLLDSN